MNSLFQQLNAAHPHLHFQEEFPLAPFAYFKIGGPAEVFVEIADKEALSTVVRWCTEHQVKLTVIGGASNVIISDQGIRGLVVRLLNAHFSVEGTKEDHTLVHAGAGLKTALLVRQAVDAGLKGLEFFLGVPGTVGGAVYNNAHYLQDLMGEHVQRVEVVTPAGEVRWLSNEECEFGYDTSRFHQSGEIIWQVEFALLPGDTELSHQRIKEATLYRAQTQPLGMPSSGCIFQNTPNTPQLQKLFPQFAQQPYVPGGFLIDQAGLKGTQEGDIQVSEKHAAFFVNTGKGTAEDVVKLIQKVRATVKEKFGAELKEEVFWLGEK